MSLLLEFLKKNGYKQLEKNIFREKVRSFFGIYEFSQEENSFYFSHPKGYEIDIQHQLIDTYEINLQFIREMKILEKGIQDENNNRFVCYNKIIFNDDVSSITQVLHDKQAVEDLVIYFDYEKNAMLSSFAINNLNTANKEIIYIEHLIFYNDKTRNELVKKDLLLKILEKNEDFFIIILQSLVGFWKTFIAKDQYKFYAIAFMLNEILKNYNSEKTNLSDNKAFLILNNLYTEKTDLLKYLTDKKYYEYQLLIKYSELYRLLNEENSNEDKLERTFIAESLLNLYDRPDFGSFSREVLAKGDVEVVHQTSGWDFIKVNGTTGYLPTEETQKEKEETQKRKYNFLADEEDIKPEKKKGFWDNLFG